MSPPYQGHDSSHVHISGRPPSEAHAGKDAFADDESDHSASCRRGGGCGDGARAERGVVTVVTAISWFASVAASPSLSVLAATGWLTAAGGARRRGGAARRGRAADGARGRGGARAARRRSARRCSGCTALVGGAARRAARRGGGAGAAARGPRAGRPRGRAARPPGAAVRPSRSTCARSSRRRSRRGGRSRGRSRRELLFDPAGPTRCVVHADRLRLTQAVGNLVLNALEHGAGPVRLRRTRRARTCGSRSATTVPGCPRRSLRSAAPPHAGRRGHGLAIAARAVRPPRRSAAHGAGQLRARASCSSCRAPTPSARSPAGRAGAPAARRHGRPRAAARGDADAR